MKSTRTIIALPATALLAAASGTLHAQSPPIESGMRSEHRLKAPARPPRPERFQWSRPVIHAPEPVAETNAGFGSSSAFSPSTAPSLTPPVTLIYGGNAPTLLIETTGPNKGLEALIKNAGSASSAIYGQSNGSGGGVTGYNSGTSGPAAKFETTNQNNSQPTLFAASSGLGSAVVAKNTSPVNATQNGSPAIFAENLSHARFAFGIQGIGSEVGIFGLTPSDGNIESIGVYGLSEAGTGVNAYSYSGTGAQIFSQSGTGAYIASDSGYGIDVESSGAAALYAYNTATKGVGVYATSEFGLAGEFEGDVLITGTLTVGSTSYSSDTHRKENVRAVDGQSLLEKIGQLPVTSWDYQNDPTRRHVGPMAQDFHAAFGLNGEDETHISEVDIAGVSLAAIKELSKQIKAKDAQILELKSQLQSLTDSFSARLTALERQGVSAKTAAVSVDRTVTPK